MKSLTDECLDILLAPYIEQHQGRTIEALSDSVDRVQNFDRGKDNAVRLQIIDSLYADVQREMQRPHTGPEFLALAEMELALLCEAGKLREGRA